jgi:hypothetical protein
MFNVDDSVRSRKATDSQLAVGDTSSPCFYDRLSAHPPHEDLKGKLP